MDFLSLFDDDNDGPAPDVPSHSEPDPSGGVSAQHGMQLERTADAAVAIVAPVEESERPRKPRFYNSRGTAIERKAWNLDMQLHRAKKKAVRNENDILNLLATFKRRSATDGTVMVHRTKSKKRGNLFSRAGLVKVSCLKVASRGNRFVSKWAMSDFLSVSFGHDTAKGRRIMSRNSQALAMQMAPSTVATMRAVTAGATMARQYHLPARILMMCKGNPPQVVGLREAWDETGQIITVNRDRGAWQICVVRHTLLLLWSDSDDDRKVIKVPVATRLSNRVS